MSEVSIFETASRVKLRFQTAKGLVSTEDLWTLPLTKLDEIAVEINSKIKATATGSFLTPKTNPDTELSLGLDILIHIMTKRQAESVAIRDLEKRKAEKQKLLSLIDQKKNDRLAELSLEELTSMANSL
jgi:hypothetical protein